jgi:membrane protease YdiL (CAAX protease family)
MATQNLIPAMPIWASALFFGVSSLVVSLAIYWLAPVLIARNTALIYIFIVLSVPMLLMFIAAWVGYFSEGNKFSWGSIKVRFRFKKMQKKDWLWVLACVIFTFLCDVSLHFTAKYLSQILWKTPEVLESIFKDLPNSFAGETLKGRWEFVFLYLVVFFFNIMGEELWWRGYIMPCQERTHGKHTWWVHGLFWTAFHIFFPTNLIKTLPANLLMLYAIQQQQNTWVGVAVHGIHNGVLLIFILIGVLGLG